VPRYVPVCLNALLYQKERRGRMERFLWDEPEGLYLDYDFATGGLGRTNGVHLGLLGGVATPSDARRA